MGVAIAYIFAGICLASAIGHAIELWYKMCG